VHSPLVHKDGHPNEEHTAQRLSELKSARSSIGACMKQETSSKSFRPLISGQSCISEVIDGIAYPKAGMEETRRAGQRIATYWYYWPYDLIRGDGKDDYEPVSIVQDEAGMVMMAVSRVHWARIRHLHVTEMKNGVQVYFAKTGHTPVVKVRRPSSDIEVERMGDALDALRRAWVSGLYSLADASGWTGTGDYEMMKEFGPPQGSKARLMPYF